ncbi:MAG: ATP-binding cassette domain-containing protein [Candidatus Krumholzibacteria bacterium]|nr:ATP-binding cassette domain-containing protein [Candidatus Krumholzibacteria bacterium]
MPLELEHLTKRYGGLAVVDDVSLRIEAGELFVLLGPSGSGKSTLLRMIAGLTDVENGSVRFHDRDITRISPKDRGFGFVFQHYALFRHMTVAENVEFALRVRKVPTPARRERREELLQLVGLSGFAGRFPRQLSGGQQQRVALARALVHKPEVLLLDEPFGALDAKIRLELRHALRAIHRELKLTTVFVTHDQEEAFELADCLAILHEGRLLEVGNPRELYLRPQSPFVATFLGAANLVVGESAPRAVRLGPVELPAPPRTATARPARRVQVLFRPEDLELSQEMSGEHPRLGLGIVENQAFVGAYERLRLKLPPLAGVRAVAPSPPFGGGHIPLEIVRPQHEAARLPLAAGASVWVAVRRFHVLAPASLRLLVETGEAPPAQMARRLGEDIAAQIGAYLELLGEPMQSRNRLPSFEEKYALSGETESGAEGFDIAVLAHYPERVERIAAGLNSIRHHLLLVPGPAKIPSRLLICVAVGEPGKAGVRFGERLAWQLGAQATVLTVLPKGGSGGETPGHVARFLAGCVRTLSERGVTAHSKLRRGDVVAEIRAEIEEGRHDLLVLGAPLRVAGAAARLQGPLNDFLHRPSTCPLLIVQRQTKG